MAKRKKDSDNVRVIIRSRPLFKSEEAKGHKSIVTVDKPRHQITVQNPDDPSKPRTFTFDAVYDPSCGPTVQQDVYQEQALPIVDSVLEGFNGTIFAYGQTGTGKTFTMTGEPTPEQRGIIPNSFHHIFSAIEREGQGRQYLVRAGYLEIYMEDVRDLLSKDYTRKLAIRESPDTGIFVEDLTWVVVKGAKELERVMIVGNKNRKQGVTDMNARSSRSHAILMVNIECSEQGEDGEAHIRSGKLNLVDLAGSERLSKTHAEGERAKEGIKINLSLSNLGQVIKALVAGKGQAHVPYRNSSLTRLLADSLGGNSKTMMIATVGPADYNYSETLETLAYANRAKSIKNKPKINEDPKDALLRKYQDELEELKKQLEGKGSHRKGKKKRKTKPVKYDDAGNVVPSTSGDEEDGEDGEDEVVEVVDEAEEQRIREEELKKLDADKKAMEADTSMLQSEKEQMLKAMEEREMELRVEAAQTAELNAKIQALQSRLLVGGTDIQTTVKEQERKLKAERQRVRDEERKAEELKRQLEARESKRLAAEESYTSLQDEIASKKEKIEKLKQKLQKAADGLHELEDEFIGAREQLLADAETLHKQVRLRELIVEHFVPPAEADKIRARAFYDEEIGWRLKSVAHSSYSAGVMARPLSAYVDRIQPTTLFAQMQSRVDENPRWRKDNVMAAAMDMPERTTSDYEGPHVNAKLQAAIDDALREEQDLVVEESVEDFIAQGIKTAKKGAKKSSSRTSKQSKARPKTAKGAPSRSRTAASQAEFPTSRGLVSDK
eukprot:m.267975 g.267975  ORF g.267975 m.267975 type:complete len:780 (-) comp15648_c1_seq1:308-2647(-)